MQLIHFNNMQRSFLRCWCRPQLIGMSFNPIHHGDMMNTQMTRYPAITGAINIPSQSLLPHGIAVETRRLWSITALADVTTITLAARTIEASFDLPLCIVTFWTSIHNRSLS